MRGVYILIFLAGFLASFPAAAESVMDRINKTQTIRCGYVSYTPASTKDLTTGKMVGYNVDLMEEAARRMGLKVEWTYETNWPVIPADLDADKFDLLCVGYWSSPKSARFMLGTDPLFYQPVFFVARADDNRFDTDISKVNDPSVTVSVLEGDVPEVILDEVYPQAKRDVLPQSSSFSQVFLQVAGGKADVTIASRLDAEDFIANNPGKLKVIMAHPVRLYGCVMQMRKEEVQLQSALNTTFREMQLDGTIEKILKKYAKSPHDYYFVKLPYTTIDLAPTQP